MVSILVCQLLRIKPCVVASEGVVPAFVRRMAPHLCGVELDMVTKAARQGKEAPEILKVIARRRQKLKAAGAKGGVPLAQAFCRSACEACALCSSSTSYIESAHSCARLCRNVQQFV